MKFNYQARTKIGDTQSGIVEASNEEVALSILQKYGLYVTTLKEVKRSKFFAKEIRIFGGVSTKDRVMFARQLSIMFKAKVPLVESLRVLVVQTPNLFFREKILRIAEDVEGGSPFSKALSRFPDIFSGFFTAMVKSGETAGRLSGALEYLADHLEKEHDFRSRVQGAMLYPIMVIFVMLAVVAVMLLFVFPQIVQLVEDMGVEPPLVTKILFGLVAFLKKWIIVMILAAVTGILFLFQYLKTKEGKELSSRFFLKIPVLKNLLQMIYLTRFSENLSTLFGAGVPITKALEVSAEVVGNTVYKKIILETRDEVRKGETIHSVLQKYPNAFPPVFTQMTLIGEKTGTLDKTLLHLVSFYQREVERSLDSVLELLVPLTIIFLGVIVGGLVGVVMLTLYKVVGGLGI
ncbi:type II secretion system F family protein [Patescibacteria group bacterium]|nr:type II secretion system F family protein [Patescibacteria group bacterium]